MSFNRLLYDQCNINQKVVEESTPFTYYVNPIYNVNFQRCNNYNRDSEHQFQISDQKIDLENDLLNLDRKTSKCNGEKFNPSCNNGVMCDEVSIKKFGNNYLFSPPEICHDLFSIIDNNIKKPELKNFDPKDYNL